MQTSIFIARLIGPVLLVVGLAYVANRRGFRDMAEGFIASPALLFLAGLIAMPAGLAIVLTHNVWTADWRVLITLLGWLTAIGGALRLAAPQFVVRTARGMLTRSSFHTISCAIWIVLGLVLCFFGYR